MTVNTETDKKLQYKTTTDKNSSKQPKLTINYSEQRNWQKQQ